MFNILVSGASGIVGYGILKSLRSSNAILNLIGTSIYKDSVAQGFCDIFEKAVPTDNKNYIDWLINVIKKHKIDLIIPGIEADLYKWSEHKNQLEKHGVIVLINNLNLVRLCRDKWNFFLELDKIKSPYIIKTSVKSDFDEIINEFGLPFILKPKRGFGSKGVVKVINKEIFNLYKDSIGDQLISQQFVGNKEEEFTTSAFCDGKGSYFTSMTLRRKLSKDGYTDWAETYDLDNIDVVLEHFCAYFKPIGPTNFQFRRHNGSLKLLEINPRISSATSIRTAFGYNESKMVIEFFLENKIPNIPILKKGKVIRFIEDKIFYDDRNNI